VGITRESKAELLKRKDTFLKRGCGVMNKIIITGATGITGSAMARCALERDMEVLCIIRKNTARFDILPKSERIKIVYADMSEYAHLDISGSYDIFYHLAWDKTDVASHGDIGVQVTNIPYTLDAVHLAKRLGCKKFVGAGSHVEYGTIAEPLRPDTPVNPLSGYAVAKYTAGKLSSLLCSQLGLQFNWTRIVTLYGPFNRERTLITYAINELCAGRSPEFTKCEQIWDYLYSDDAARAFLAIGHNGVDGKTYTLGSGKTRRLSEYLELLKDIVNPAGILQFGKKDYFPNQPMYLCADISELTNDTEWKPQVSFEDGVRMIMQFEGKI
jgi:UDP-glucose 4-epimerase